MIAVIRERRSIRRFNDRKVETEKVEILQELLLRSPSGKNTNPWEFVFIDNPELISNLRRCKSHGTLPLETAPLVVTVCADENKTDTWIEDCSIAAALLQVSAQALGLGSCWVHIRNRYNDENRSSEDFVREILKIPSNYRVLCLITIGYPGENKEPKALKNLFFEKIRRNVF